MSESNPVSEMRDHYDRHLAPLYTWMVGDVEEALNRSRAALLDLGLKSEAGGTAIDLGCGFGLQSIPLADLGYDVVGIDFSEELLAELERRRGGRRIRGVRADLREFASQIAAPVELVVCMGDTLPHLPDLESVDRLMVAIASILRPGGRLLLSFRDYCSVELQGTQRFIPVRSDADRIFTCVLEYGASRMTVTDLVHERTETGWRQRASSYPKLRLAPDWLVQRLETSGLSLVSRKSERGLVTLLAQKPA